MPSSPVVIIASPEALAELRHRAGIPDDALSFPDTEPLRALEVITQRRPSLIILERFFATTPRGAALITRIKADPSLAEAEIRVIAHDSEYSRVVARPRPAPLPPPGSAAGRPDPSLDWRGTRRAPRFRIREGVEVLIDGNPSALIDLSRIGAQVVGSRSLRPDQRVRVTIPHEKETARISASVAWAKFEVPKGRGQYRAGLEFANADPVFVDAFCALHRRDA